ncbi:MAG: FtsX-like permease family protein, partial [Bacteroidota bacterium]
PGLSLDLPLDWVSYEYGRTVGWQFVAGRDFSRSFKTDTTAFVINETAARFMGLKEPAGKMIYWQGHPYTIIGVIKDMLAESPYEPVRPSFFHLSTDPGTRMIVKINPTANTREALEKIEGVLKKYAPEQPFNYEFADQEYARKFGYEQRLGRIAVVFALLAIFISCLGLFGMASFMAEQRTKEIGVRKVLGASLLSLWGLLSIEFVELVLLSLCIAIPLSWYFMTGWLQHYAYHAALAWWIFAAAGLGALLITLLTVSYQSIRAATSNPVKSLRTE